MENPMIRDATKTTINVLKELENQTFTKLITYKFSTYLLLPKATKLIF